MLCWTTEQCCFECKKRKSKRPA